MSREEFSDKLQELMTIHNLTTREAAARMCTAPGVVSRWLTGRAAPARLLRELRLNQLATNRQ